MIKKVIIVLLLSLCSIVRSFSQQQGPIDLIVLLDTSAGMSSHYPEVTNYLSGPFLREFLRLGDTFHLISFSAVPRTELARRIEGFGDVETILGRITVMYPLDPGSDINRALEYAERYIASLPAGREKKVILITDGDQQAAEGRITETGSRLKRLGTELYPVMFPLTGNGPSSGRTARASSRGNQAAAGLVQEARADTSGSAPGRADNAAPVTAAVAAGQSEPPRQDRPVQAAPRAEPAAEAIAPPTAPASPAASGPAIAAPGSRAAQDQAQPVPSAGSNDIPTLPGPSAAGNEEETANPAQSGGIITQVKPVPGLLAFPFQPRTLLAGTPPRPLWPRLRLKAASTPAEPAVSAADAGTSAPVTPKQEQLRVETGTGPEVSSAGSVPASGGITAPAPRSETAIPETLRSAEAAGETPSVPETAADNTVQSAQDRGSTERSETVGSAAEGLVPAEDTTGTAAAQNQPSQMSTGNTRPEQSRNRFPLTIILVTVLGLGLLAAAGFAAVRIFRRLHSSPGRAMAYVAGRIVSSPSRTQPQSGLTGAPMISLFVEDQNVNIGRRNIHTLKAGNRYTIGGGKSDFLIFLVPLPPRIGEIYFDGEQCTFVPKKPEYFPDIGAETVPNCIGKTVRVLSDNQYQLRFHLERYEDPLATLNRLLNSINMESALRV